MQSTTSTGKKKIAIVGMGVAGSYLINQLTRRGHEVTGYERYTENNFECVCAWGTSKYGIKSFVENCDLDFQDYIIHEGIKFRMEYGDNEYVSDATGLVTFDKHRMVLDMQKGHRIIYGKWVRSLEEEYDMVIDATGGIRGILPKMQNPDLQIPVVQYRMKFDNPPMNDFYLKMFETNSGYFWYFPLGNGEAHIGAGDYYRNHIHYIDEFVKKHPAKRIKIVGRPIRLVPPSRCEPFYSGKIVGVGESIGTVFPLAGEGIIPSLQCADIFLDNMQDFQKYRRAVLRHFRVFEDAGELLRSLLTGKFTIPDDLARMTRVFSELSNNPKRYGISINPSAISFSPFLEPFSINLNIKL
jgi:flavin-dependent dehydrogenase